MTTIADVAAAVRGPLGELGFAKRAGQVFTVNLSAEVLGWLGLNSASKRLAGAVEVHPVVGARHQVVERFVAELRGERFHPYQPPTVSTPLGYLMPQGSNRAWLFEEGSDPVAVGADLATAVSEFGLPFMRETDELEAFLAWIDQGFGFFLEYRRPVTLALLGRDDEASADLRGSVAALRDRDDAAAAELRGFAEAFEAAGPLRAG